MFQVQEECDPLLCFSGRCQGSTLAVITSLVFPCVFLCVLSKIKLTREEKAQMSELLWTLMRSKCSFMMYVCAFDLNMCIFSSLGWFRGVLTDIQLLISFGGDEHPGASERMSDLRSPL